MPIAASFFIIVSELFGVVPKTFFWWYSDGLARLFDWIKGRLSYRWRALAFRFWASHLLQPMYGQSDFAGRAISVVMRFLVLIWRLFVLAGSLLLYAFVLMTWFFLPAAIVAVLVLNSMSAFGLILVM